MVGEISRVALFFTWLLHILQTVSDLIRTSPSFQKSMLFLAAILDLVLDFVFRTKMFFSFSQILVISICDSFSPVLVDESSNRF